MASDAHDAGGPRRPAHAPVRSLVTHGLGSLFFEGLSFVGKLHPEARRHLGSVEIVRDVAYAAAGGHPEHRLDVYRPPGATGTRPVVLYLHGGGFHTLSKETHWIMALAFARAGYVVCNVSYRLADKHPFPAALEDAVEAFAWAARRAGDFGGDVSRLVFAGESAGANLVTALAVATCFRRPEAYARRAFDLGLVPRAVVAGCGILQVSDPGRFARRRKLPWWVGVMLNDISAGYLRGARAGAELADPLLVLERGEAPERPLPPFFAFAGTRDPILDDTRRLGAALATLGVEHEVRYYPGEVHAFHALMVREAARQCWRDKLAFLDRQLGAEGAPAGDAGARPPSP
jgi:acetyl esterase